MFSKTMLKEEGADLMPGGNVITKTYYKDED
jgi:hypothetical protein